MSCVNPHRCHRHQQRQRGVGEMWGNCRDHLFDIAACLGTGLDEHDVQLFGSLLSFLNCDLPAGKEIHFTGETLTYTALTCCQCLVHNI